MATLQKIRNRAGLLVAIVIGLSLLAFILQDILTRANVLTSGNQDEIAVVGGKSVSYKYFNQKVDEMVENYKEHQYQVKSR